MALTTIGQGDEATSSVLNNNFQYLQSQIEQVAASIPANNSSFSSQVSTLGSSISTLQTAVNTINSTLATLQTSVNSLNSGRGFVQVTKELAVGQNSLSEYLPKDSNQYLVWLYGHVSQPYNSKKSAGYQESVQTDLMTAKRYYLWEPYHASRAITARALIVVPVGASRVLTITRNYDADTNQRWVVGYARL